ncbi:MAG: Cof-type HAD-IIB family hydrolase [Methylobacterium sp.]|uniref:Cof-type HAD-IIB family hydrolase n=1 Tax=Methylobacterium sp. TaxID=409 RepID=UPI0025FB1B54|nr:Cof-type HAD-IIB family hydrolase [Methylobacterium sp.]MBX9933555.1 Cof-type HAD-IIB family hydrolase [Methylobacterium sp.]
MSPRPKPQRLSLLLADVDGTLVDENKILTERAAAAVRALRRKGARFAVTSGRPPRGMAMLIEPLALHTVIAGFNGGVFVRPDLSIIAEKTLSRTAAEEAVRTILDHGLDAWVYAGNDWLIRKKDAAHVAREAWTVKFEPTVTDDLARGFDRAAKVVGVSDDYDRVAACEAALQERLGAQASAARSQPYYVDVTHPEANKGFVVEYLSRELGIPADEIATIGDMPNDVLMFRKSGFSIAMGNASAEVQSQADAVTASYTDDGFAKAVERYLLDDDGHSNSGGSA